MNGRERAREYIRNRYGQELTDAELDELIKQETGGKHVEESDYDVMPGGFEIRKPTWDAYR